MMSRTRAFSRPCHTSTRRANPRARLALQPLEDRAVPATFTVTTTSDSGVGSLRDAIAQANGNAEADTITFDVATFATAKTISLTGGELLIDTDHALSIAPDLSQVAMITVNAGQASRVFRIESGTAVSIDGLTISRGRAVGQGGGILNAGTLTLSHAIVSNNQAVGVPGAGVVVDAFGGGIFNTGTLSVGHTTFVHNQAIGGDGSETTTGTSALGGALMSAGSLSAPATTTIRHSTFVGNQAIGGAAGGPAMAGAFA